MPRRKIASETLALLAGVVEFVIAVGQFQRTDINLETLRDGHVAGLDLRQRALAGGIVVDDEDAIGRDGRLDQMRHQQVEPVVAGQPVRIDVVHRQRAAQFGLARGERVEAEAVLVELAETHVADGGAAPGQVQGVLHQLGAFVHQFEMVPADAIPLEHGEFGIVPLAGFAVAEHPSELVAVADAGGEQTLERELRRRAQPAHACAGGLGPHELQLETFDVRIGVAGRGQDRRLDLEHLAFGEIAADQRVELGAQAQGLGVRGRFPVFHALTLAPARDARKTISGARR